MSQQHLTQQHGLQIRLAANGGAIFADQPVIGFAGELAQFWIGIHFPAGARHTCVAPRSVCPSAPLPASTMNRRLPSRRRFVASTAWAGMSLGFGWGGPMARRCPGNTVQSRHCR